MECQMLNKSALLLIFLLALLIMPASGTGTAGMYGPTKIIFVDNSKTGTSTHGQPLGFQTAQFVKNDNMLKDAIKCTVTVEKESNKMTAVLDLKKCNPMLERAEQLRGMVLSIVYFVGGTAEYTAESMHYRMEEGLSAEELESFFRGGMLYLLKREKNNYYASKLFVNRDGIAIHAMGSQQRTKMIPENFRAGENGPMEIVSTIENPHGHEVVVHSQHTWQQLWPFKASDDMVERNCHVDHVPAKSSPTELVFSVDLKRCHPPLKDPLDLAEMRLSGEYSIGGVEKSGTFFKFPPEDGTFFYDDFKMLFGGGKKLLLSSVEVVDIETEASGSSSHSHHMDVEKQHPPKPKNGPTFEPET